MIARAPWYQINLTPEDIEDQQIDEQAEMNRFKRPGSRN
jgi:hypothetical protein